MSERFSREPVTVIRSSSVESSSSAVVWAIAGAASAMPIKSESTRMAG